MRSFAKKIKDDPVDGPGSAVEESGSDSGSDSNSYHSYSKGKPRAKKKVVPKPYFPALKYVRCYKVHFGEPNDWDSTAETVDHLVSGFGNRPEPKYSHVTMYVTQCINFSGGDVDYMAENSDCDVVFDGSQSWDEEYREAQYRDDPLARFESMFW
ncbi:hypothetical protein FA13DRAFT_468599 [Coprinellus micaceus]|jgi:hypothetical protein|uniref:Uncharacterized protein n=1 Tax=Coprinellus micaceus TaxID=71717 RepID=A0A4Y7TZA6_COPMI|nr:hypothetical protein FA13DRAFT_468599 [Coprinellus micaceus]